MNASIGAGNLLSKTIPITSPWEILTRGELEKVCHFAKCEFVNSWIHEDQKIAVPRIGNAARKRLWVIDGMILRKFSVNRNFYILKIVDNPLQLLWLIVNIDVCTPLLTANDTP
jgi:hypothetical protein